MSRDLDITVDVAGERYQFERHEDFFCITRCSVRLGFESVPDQPYSWPWPWSFDFKLDVEHMVETQHLKRPPPHKPRPETSSGPCRCHGLRVRYLFYGDVLHTLLILPQLIHVQRQ